MTKDIQRIAEALERIADALEAASTHPVLGEPHVDIKPGAHSTAIFEAVESELRRQGRLA